MARLHAHRSGPALGAVVALVATTALAALPASGAETDAGTEPVEAGIVVDRVEGMPDDFASGVDVSTVLSLEESGVVFRDESGEPADLFTVLSDSGVNSVRIRVWNDPYDGEGRGYGGGNLDTARAVQIGERATAAGMSVLVDFHYSDFWADPAKYTVPKAWKDLTAAQRADAAGEFTTAALNEFKDAGVDVTMVQVGNETNSGVAGLTSWPERAAVFSAGSAAVRAVFPAAMVVVHYTNPERAGFYADVAAKLAEYGVDYDVFASSYYPFWHGSLDNLTSVLAQVSQTYDKKVMVAETSWVNTLEEGDGQRNVIYTQPTQYPVSVQGQATAIRDVIQAVVDVPDGAGIGVYYWEPAWLPVGPPDQIEANRQLWQQFGSGWASSYAADYDPTGDTAENWGGSGWENQALFDYQGHPLESLNVFSYARTGTTAPREVASIQQPSITIADGEPVTLPATVTVTYNDGEQEPVEVTWSGAQDWIRGAGTYMISGTTSAGSTTATVTVQAPNYVTNPGFESGTAAWTIAGTGAAITGDDPFAGSKALHFWSAAPYTFTATQQLTGLPTGDYVLSAQAQGDALGGELTLTGSGTSESSEPFDLTGWHNWSAPQVPVTVSDDGTATVRISASLPAGAWGTLDEVSLTKAPGTTADRTALQAALGQVEKVERALYTPASLAGLDHAAEIARVVLAAAAAVQGDVDQATILVVDALEGLRQNGGPPIETTAEVRCLAGKSFVAVRATNVGAEPIDVTITTPYGSRMFEQIDARGNAYQSFASRAVFIPAGTVEILATGREFRTTRTVDYDARACG